MKRTATAQWAGGLTDGGGSITTQSGVLSKTQYSFKTRFEDGIGTNPEELLAAAHAGCFTMALSLILGQAGLKPEHLQTTATISLEKDGAGFSITESHLELTGRVPGASTEAFQQAASAAEQNCPVSKLFKTKITLDAKLEA